VYLKRLSFAVPENQQKNLPENEEHRIHRMQNSVHFYFIYLFKSYEYQLLQGAGAQDKEVCYTALLRSFKTWRRQACKNFVQ
jgi:hypothetical protein